MILQTERQFHGYTAFAIRTAHALYSGSFEIGSSTSFVRSLAATPAAKPSPQWNGINTTPSGYVLFNLAFTLT